MTAIKRGCEGEESGRCKTVIRERDEQRERRKRRNRGEQAAGRWGDDSLAMGLGPAGEWLACVPLGDRRADIA